MESVVKDSQVLAMNRLAAVFPLGNPWGFGAWIHRRDAHVSSVNAATFIRLNGVVVTRLPEEEEIRVRFPVQSFSGTSPVAQDTPLGWVRRRFDSGVPDLIQLHGNTTKCCNSKFSTVVQLVGLRIVTPGMEVQIFPVELTRLGKMVYCSV